VPADEQRAVSLLRRRDQGPGRLAGRGLPQEGFADLDEVVVVLEQLAVVAGDLPGGFPVLLEPPDALLLLRLGQVEPVLDQQHALLRQHALEADDLLHARREVARGKPAQDAFEDRHGVPGAEEDADPPFRRQRAPEAPHRRMRRLLLGRDGKARDLDEARIHPFVEEVDGLALARPLHPRDQDQDREAPLRPEIALRLQQGAAQFGLLPLEVRLADLVLEFGRFEHALPSRRAARAARLSEGS
jgi:hypothetical protein